MAGQTLNPRSFPPGSSQAFIDLIVRLQQLLDNTSGDATGAADAARAAAEAAQKAAQDADQQGQRNDTQDEVLQDQQQQIVTQKGDLAALQDTVNNDVVRNDKTAVQVMAGPLSVGTELRINNVKVLGGRISGWAVTTGTQKRGGLDADAAYPVGATYSQAEMQALADGLVELRQVTAAILQMATLHGLIGA